MSLDFFTLDLRTVDLRKLWHREGDDGRLEYKVEFTLQMAFYGKEGKLQIRALTSQGMLIGIVKEMVIPMPVPAYY